MIRKEVWLKCIEKFDLEGCEYVSGHYYRGFLLESGMIQLPPPVLSDSYFTPGRLFTVESPYNEMLKKVLE